MRLFAMPSASHFSGPQEEFVFYGARISDEALARLKKALHDASLECADIIDRDRPAMNARKGAAYVLALRPWSYSGFASFERE